MKSFIKPSVTPGGGGVMSLEPVSVEDYKMRIKILGCGVRKKRAHRTSVPLFLISAGEKAARDYISRN